MPVAHIGHAELCVTDLEASREFFTDLMGLFVTEETDDRVYLRAWQDFDHHTLVLRRAAESGVEHIGWRVESEGELRRIGGRLRELGVEFSWSAGEAERGHGDSLRFLTPQGIPTELYWEVERFVEADPSMVSKLASHPQRYTGHGIAPRRFDHVNFLADDVAAEQQWLTEVLGIHHRYFVEADSGERLGSWLSRTNVSHEIALMRNESQSGTKLHHVGYYLESPTELIRAATILADAGIEIEWGPGQHGTSGAIFLYCFEPSGNRIEVWTGGFLIFAPDWEPIRWDPENGRLGLEMWGSKRPDTYFTYGTAPVLTDAAATTGSSVS
ncbi:MAG: VOC family protein [Solirubrobacterales bacterium]